MGSKLSLENEQKIAYNNLLKYRFGQKTASTGRAKDARHLARRYMFASHKIVQSMALAAVRVSFFFFFSC